LAQQGNQALVGVVHGALFDRFAEIQCHIEALAEFFLQAA
jgi:hypothetical protein